MFTFTDEISMPKYHFVIMDAMTVKMSLLKHSHCVIICTHLQCVCCMHDMMIRE